MSASVMQSNIKKEGSPNVMKGVNDLAPVLPLGKPTTGTVKPLGTQKKYMSNGYNNNNSQRRPKYAQKLTKIDFTDDSTAGRNFKAFDKPASLKANVGSVGPRNNRPPQRRPTFKGYNQTPRPTPAVEEMPNDIVVKEHIISPNNVVCFNGHDHFLSTLFEVKLEISDNVYESVEHYYQACKLFTFIDQSAAAETKKVKSSLEVKKLAKRMLQGVATKDQLNTWKATEAINVLKLSLMQKYLQNPEIKEKLLATGSKLLVHSYAGDNLFAAGENAKGFIDWATENEGKVIKLPSNVENSTVKYLPLAAKGKNVLGYLTMQIRDEIAGQVLDAEKLSKMTI